MVSLLGSCSVSSPSSSYHHLHHHSLPLPSLLHLLSSSPHNNVHRRLRWRRRRGCAAATAASLVHDEPVRSNSLKRRSLLLVGVSTFPFPQLKAGASEDAVPGLSGENIRREQENPFVALLNDVGIVGLGVLGALYALARQEKMKLLATIESMEAKLSEKEADMTKMQQNFGIKLLNEQEERSKEMKNAREIQASLSRQIASANDLIKELQKEIQAEKMLAQELVLKMNETQSNLTEVEESKRILDSTLKEKEHELEALQDKINLLILEIKDKELNMERLESALNHKEYEYSVLTSMLNNTKGELTKANSQILELEQEILKYKEELRTQKAMEEELKEKVNMVLAERDDFMNKLHVLQEEFVSFKASSEEKNIANIKLLSEKDFELAQLQEKLDIALNDNKANQMLVSDLENERDNLTRLLKKEIDNVKHLKDELQLSRETLAESRLEISNLLKEVKQSKNTCEALSSELSKITLDFGNKEKLLQNSLDEAMLSSKMLSEELSFVKDNFDKTKENFHVVSEELKKVTEDRDGLSMQLLDASRKVEISAEDLKEERKLVSSLNKELETMEKQLYSNNEARRNLEVDLEEATKSLRGVNKNAIELTRELDAVNSTVTNLEAEKDMLYRSLTEQRDASKEARENLEDAQNFISKLAKERDVLEKRSKKLEEQLASAKGEILRLRRQMNTSASTNEVQSNNDRVVENVMAKRTSRRKKGGSTSDVSD